RLLDDQATRGQIPGVEVPLPEPVEAAAGDVAEVERRRTGAAHPLRMLQRLAPEGQVEVDVLAVGVGEAGGGRRPPQLVHRGERDRGAVQARPVSPEGGEELLTDGIVDDPEEQIVLAGERDRHRELWIAVGEVRRAVERVDVPAMAVLTG